MFGVLSSAAPSVARREINESDRTASKTAILEILDEIETGIMEEKLRLGSPADESIWDDDELTGELAAEMTRATDDAGEREAEGEADDDAEVQWVPCGAGGGAAGAVSVSAPPVAAPASPSGSASVTAPAAKRSRVVVKPRMAVSPATLEITDTDTMTSLRAHRFVLKIVTEESMLVSSTQYGLEMLVGVFMAAVSTPFAALYLDMDPTKRTYRNVRDTIRHGIEKRIETCFIEEGLPLAKHLAADVCDRWSRRNSTPMQLLFSGRVNALIDAAMGKITAQLDATRQLWKRRALTVADTRVFKVTMPKPKANAYVARLELPRIEITSKLLPVDILPRAGLRKVYGYDPETGAPNPTLAPYGPSTEQFLTLNQSVTDEDYPDKEGRVSMMDAVKHALTLWAMDNEIVGLDMATQTRVTSKTITVDIMRGESE